MIALPLPGSTGPILPVLSLRDDSKSWCRQVFSVRYMTILYAGIVPLEPWSDHKIVAV